MKAKKNHFGRRNQRGIALLQTMLVITFVMMTMLITVRQSSEALKEGATARKQTLIQGAVETGINHAIDRLQQMDPARLALMPPNEHDIFDNPGGLEFVPGPITYPPTGDFANQIEIRVGMRPGQRTAPPPGEDVAAAFGIIVEIQVQVTAPDGLFGTGTAEERLVIGLRLPHTAGGAT